MTTEDAGFFVIGVATRTRNVDERSAETARIPDLWNRALAHPWLTEQRERGAEVIAVLNDYESDSSGDYTQIVGVRVDTVLDLIEGLVAVRVESSRRLVVTADGELPAALIEAWRTIWSDEESGSIEREYGTDFETYSGGGAQIHLSIRERFPVSDG